MSRTLTQGEHLALARLHRAAAECMRYEFILDDFDFANPRDMAKRAGETAKSYSGRDRDAMLGLKKAATGYAMVKEVAEALTRLRDPAFRAAYNGPLPEGFVCSPEGAAFEAAAERGGK